MLRFKTKRGSKPFRAEAIRFSLRPVHWLAVAALTLTTTAVIFPRDFWLLLWRAVLARRFWITMLLLYIVLALSLIWKSWETADDWLFRFINDRGRRPRWLDRFMLAVTQLGNGLFACMIALVFYIQSQRLFAYELVVGNTTLWLIVETMKMFFHRDRPYSALKQMRVVGTKERGTSFPSGHTSQAFFMAAIVSHSFNLNQELKLLLYTVALCVGITRIYVGMHFPRDVLGGAILGTTWGLTCLILCRYIYAFALLKGF